MRVAPPQAIVRRVLTWPAPERNKQPILDVLARLLPARGRVLEIASGTGQHVLHFAAALPQLAWLPTDPDPLHLDAIKARLETVALPNVEPPVGLDVTRETWPEGTFDAVVCINMIHIAPWTATEALLAGAERHLPTGGVLFLYGPFRRGGHTAPSNEAFDESLRNRDPAWGVRDLETVEALAAQHRLALTEVVEMPANNLSVCFVKSHRR
ncbi:DUF938 domain-containing protein [bacterium]|nr:MAG: DUF938 domain-containing protein [bacterium]